jgi:hypothetical protein
MFAKNYRTNILAEARLKKGKDASKPFDLDASRHSPEIFQIFLILPFLKERNGTFV